MKSWKLKSWIVCWGFFLRWQYGKYSVKCCFSNYASHFNEIILHHIISVWINYNACYYQYVWNYDYYYQICHIIIINIIIFHSWIQITMNFLFMSLWYHFKSYHICYFISYILLRYVILYDVLLHGIVLHYNMLHCVVWYYIILCVTLYYIILHFIVWYDMILY